MLTSITITITYNVLVFFALSVECFNVKYSEHRVCDEATLRLRRIADLSDPTQLRRRSWNSSTWEAPKSDHFEEPGI